MTEPKESQIAEERRRMLVDEYCRNVGNIKIKCDDCKFVEDCVDYGWKDCKKFTPAPSEPMTNEEYIRTCSTGELAALIYQDRWTQSDGWYEQTGHTVEDVKNWLKEIRK